MNTKLLIGLVVVALIGAIGAFSFINREKAAPAAQENVDVATPAPSDNADLPTPTPVPVTPASDAVTASEAVSKPAPTPTPVVTNTPAPTQTPLSTPTPTPVPAKDEPKTSTSFDAKNFVVGINNPYLTYKPGTTYIYEGEDDEGEEVRVEIEVTSKTRLFMGVTTMEIVERLYDEDDEQIETSSSWLAQDSSGNVWMFGEYSEEEEGDIIEWYAGDAIGTKPGIIMKANPVPGDTYLNEYLKGVTETGVGIVSVTEKITVPYGSYQSCLKTREWTPQEPDAIDYKTYCKGVAAMVKDIPKTGDEFIELTNIEN